MGKIKRLKAERIVPLENRVDELEEWQEDVKKLLASLCDDKLNVKSDLPARKSAELLEQTHKTKEGETVKKGEQSFSPPSAGSLKSKEKTDVTDEVKGSESVSSQPKAKGGKGVRKQDSKKKAPAEKGEEAVDDKP